MISLQCGTEGAMRLSAGSGADICLYGRTDGGGILKRALDIEKRERKNVCLPIPQTLRTSHSCPAGQLHEDWQPVHLPLFTPHSALALHPHYLLW